MIPNEYGLFVTIYAIVLAVILVIYVWTALALTPLFRKADVPPSHAWIPFVNMFTLVKISGRPESPWLLLVPFYGIYIQFLVVTAVSNRFGRSNGFGWIGLFFFPVWASILGWGSARWMGVQSGVAEADYSRTSSRVDQTGALSWLEQSAPEVPVHNTWDPFAPLANSQSTPTSAQPVEPASAVPQPPAEPAASGWDAPAGGWAAPAAPAAAPAADVWGAPAAVPPPPAAAAAAPVANPFAPPAAPSVPASAQVPPPPPTMSASAALAGGIGNPGSTRMHEDSEVVAQARRAQAMTPPPLPPLPINDDVPATPIVVPGSSATIPAPPVPLTGSVPIVEGTAFEDSEWMQNSLSTGIANVATPVSAAASVSTQTVADEAGDELWAPRLRRSVEDEPSYEEPDSQSASISAVSAIESSVEVSAVAPVPEAGMPRAARASVSAHHADAGVPSDEGIDDQTIVASRRRTLWNLNLPVGTSVALTSDYVILGRRPEDEPEFPSAQLISVADGTRTISKTHAVLALVDGAWTITDLGSTNGVVLIDDAGTETEIDAHQPAVLTARFLLGDAELSIEAASE